MNNSILQVTSKDWHINQKSIPTVSSLEYDAYFEYQRNLCLKGCTVDGVFINPYLYWHLNFWNTEVDFLNPNGGLPLQKYVNPLLRDNEWLIFDSIWRAEQERKGLAIMGCRRLGKSVFESSYISHGATFDEDSQNIISGLNSDDIKLITDKINKGLNKLPEAFQWMRVEENWSKAVTLGVRDKQNKKTAFSQILIRNLDGGSNEEAIAGTKPRKLIIDECGKGPFLRGLQAGLPGMTTPYGWTASPIVVGTSGDMERYHDSQKLFKSPDAYNFISFENTKKSTGTPHSLFMGAKFRLEGKEESTLAEYLGKPDSEELGNIPILVSNEEKAFEATDKIVEALRQSGDKQAYLKERMYYPKTIDELFLSVKASMFNKNLVKNQIQTIDDLEIKGAPVELFYGNTGKIEWKASNKSIITSYPLGEQSSDAPVCIWEHPIPNPPKYLYVAGCLLPGEKVLTDTGLKSVEYVSEKDKLVNSNGDYVEIKTFYQHEKIEEDVYKLKISNTYRTTTFTAEHPILVSEAYKNKSINVENSDFKFKPIRDLKNNDWTKVPVLYTDENSFDVHTMWDNTGERIDRHIENPILKEDFWWFVGLFLGDGWCESSKTNKSKVSVAMNTQEVFYIDKLNRVVQEVFGRKVSIRKRGSGGCTEVTFCMGQLNRFLNTHFGKGAAGKCIPEWVKRMPEYCKKALLLGYLDADGCIESVKLTGYSRTSFISINLLLLEGIQDILFSIGIVSSLSLLRKEGSGISKMSKTKECFQLRIGHTGTMEMKEKLMCPEDIKLKRTNDDIKVKDRPNKGCFFSVDGKYLYFQIKDIEKSKYTGKVYNFECDTNTFLCRSITTHNCDSYKFSKSGTDSLGAVYIYKRTHSITGEGLQDTFVASYIARPEEKEEWNETARMLIKYYNAYGLVENDEDSFIEFMKSKGEAEIYLAPQPQFQKSVVQTTKLDRKFGVSRSSSKIRNFLHGLYKDYMEEVIVCDRDENDNIIREIRGVTRIFDRALLQLTGEYDGVINADQIVAAELALALAKDLDPIVGHAGSKDEDSRFQALFGNKRNNKRKRKLFLNRR